MYLRHVVMQLVIICLSSRIPQRAAAGTWAEICIVEASQVAREYQAV
jgi:hypothetical protein